VVRALVNALRERAGLTGGSRSQAYLRLALQIATTAGPRLLITHGLPGSGKTYVTQQLIGAAGAVRFRSDVERKRLAGLAALADSRAAGDLYTADITQATYERLNRFARSSLQGGWPTVIDAAFLRRSQRDASRQLAHELDAPFAILHCHAGMPVLRERVAQRQARGGDASEADVAVLEMLAQRGEPLGGDERAQTIEVDTTAALDIDRIVERWCLPR
jgi:predicted kinase